MNDKIFHEGRRSVKELRYIRGSNNFYLTIFVFGFYFVVGTIMLLSRNDDFTLSGYLFSFVIFVVPVFIYNLIDFMFYKKYEKIEKYGVRVDGFISNIGYRVDNHEKRTIKYYLVVDYNDPVSGKFCTYKTPCVNFNPIYCLGSRNCSVYVYKRSVYVTDFVKNEGAEPVLRSEDFNLLNDANINLRFFGNMIFKRIIFPLVFGLIIALIMWNIYK